MSSDPKNKPKLSELKPTMIGAGLAIGAGVGVAVGVAMGNISIGIAIGISIGVAIGAGLEKTSKSLQENDESE